MRTPRVHHRLNRRGGRMRAVRVAVVSAAVLFASCGGEAEKPSAVLGGPAAPRYRIQELPPVEGVTGLWPRGINSHGDVVGSYTPPGVTGGPAFRAFLYNAASGDVRRIGTDTVVAFAVNDHVQVALTTDAARTAGSRWEAGLERDIGVLDPRSNYACAVAINSSGWLAGWSASSSGRVHAVLWDGSTLRDLTPDETATTGALWLNSSGLAVGFLFSADGVSHAVLFGPSGVKDLGSLGGEGRAMSVNDAGRIVGYSAATGSGEHGFVYDLPSGPMRDVSPNRRSILRAVNSGGDAVGAFLGPLTDGPDDRAMLWRAGTLVDLTEDLGDPEWVLVEGDAINDSGMIVGRGRHKGSPRGFILTPH